jgi:two-component system, OmpR family, phosphate regulon sensor histidine kinase PhoR
MKNLHLRKIILAGTFLLGCLMVVQVYWFSRAFDVAEKQFDHSVQVALKKVADSVSRDAAVKKLSSNFFFAQTESQLDPKALDSLIEKELKRRDLPVKYELGVYDAYDDTLVYGNYVEGNKALKVESETGLIAGTPDRNFAVYFPDKRSYLASELNIWIFSTFILLMMSGFFAYAIYSLLKEKKFAEVKNDFINNMTHEFKTPVTNIGIAGQILKQKSQPEVQRYVDILLKENEKLKDKIEQVLLGASVEHIGRRQFQEIDVHQIVKDCAEAFDLKLQERNGSLQLQLNSTSSVVYGDRELLSQAINNVIDNAEKYSPEKPQIVLRTKDTVLGIEISIADRGIGIPVSMTRKVFEKFFRVPSGDVHNVKGFGLGLSFVKQVIDHHRGKINLLSDLNQGTQVTIILPKA